MIKAQGRHEEEMIKAQVLSQKLAVKQQDLAVKAREIELQEQHRKEEMIKAQDHLVLSHSMRHRYTSSSPGQHSSPKYGSKSPPKYSPHTGALPNSNYSPNCFTPDTMSVLEDTAAKYTKKYYDKIADAVSFQNKHSAVKYRVSLGRGFSVLKGLIQVVAFDTTEAIALCNIYYLLYACDWNIAEWVDRLKTDGIPNLGVRLNSGSTPPLSDLYERSYSPLEAFSSPEMNDGFNL